MDKLIASLIDAYMRNTTAVDLEKEQITGQQVIERHGLSPPEQPGCGAREISNSHLPIGIQHQSAAIKTARGSTP